VLDEELNFGDKAVVPDEKTALVQKEGMEMVRMDLSIAF
jgi:hypothetical protein